MSWRILGVVLRTIKENLASSPCRGTSVITKWLSHGEAHPPLSEVLTSAVSTDEVNSSTQFVIAKAEFTLSSVKGKGHCVKANVSEMWISFQNRV